MACRKTQSSLRQAGQPRAQALSSGIRARGREGSINTWLSPSSWKGCYKPWARSTVFKSEGRTYLLPSWVLTELHCTSGCCLWNGTSGPCLAVCLVEGLITLSWLKHSEKSDLRERGFIWVQSMREGIPTSGASTLATSHLQSGSRERWMLALSSFPLFYVIQDPRPQNDPAHILGGSCYLQLS